MSNKKTSGKASVLALFGTIAVTSMFLANSLTRINAGDKVYVCKYVGTPGVNETLQTGQNPIEVSINSIGTGWSVGAYFNDQHGRSYVLGYVPMNPEPNVNNCPQPNGSPSPNPTASPTATATATASPTATATATASPSSSPTAGPTSTPIGTPTATPAATPTDSPVATATPTGTATPTATPNLDVCPNIDGIQTGLPDGYHFDASGINCVQFQFGGPPQDGGVGGTGQVLGTSTGQVLGLASTGSFAENAYLAIMALGATITAFGIKNFKKAYKQA